MTIRWPEPAAANGYLQDHVTRLCESYRRYTGRELLAVEDPIERARALYFAPFVVVSHGTESDPIFNYGNRIALDLFAMSWEEFTALPSRLSAEPMHRDERARLMTTVREYGFIDDYQGIRIAKTGKRFRITQATVWNIHDAQGVLLGQAATFSYWDPIDAPGGRP